MAEDRIHRSIWDGETSALDPCVLPWIAGVMWVQLGIVVCLTAISLVCLIYLYHAVYGVNDRRIRRHPVISRSHYDYDKIATISEADTTTKSGAGTTTKYGAGPAIKSSTGTSTRSGIDTHTKFGADTTTSFYSGMSTRSGIDTHTKSGADTTTSFDSGMSTRSGIDTHTKFGADTTTSFDSGMSTRSDVDTHTRFGADTATNFDSGMSTRSKAGTKAMSGVGTTMKARNYRRTSSDPGMKGAGGSTKSVFGTTPKSGADTPNSSGAHIVTKSDSTGISQWYPDTSTTTVDERDFPTPRPHSSAAYWSSVLRGSIPRYSSNIKSYASDDSLIPSASHTSTSPRSASPMHMDLPYSSDLSEERLSLTASPEGEPSNSELKSRIEDMVSRAKAANIKVSWKNKIIVNKKESKDDITDEEEESGY